MLGVGKAQIEGAFEALGARADGKIQWSTLARKLKEGGEAVSEFELLTCLNALTGGEDVGGPIDAAAFADKVLGFQDYSAADEAYEDGGEDGGEED